MRSSTLHWLSLSWLRIVFGYVTDGANIRFDDRHAYIAGRESWAEWQAARRSLLYSIQDMDSDEAGRYVSVAAYSTYETKYFRPRYLENLLFEKIKGKWMLKQQILVPLHPSKPELYEVQIFVSARRYPQSYIQRELARAPDELVELYRKGRLQKGVPTDNKRRSVLFVFREPPPVGAKIMVRHSWWSPDVGHPTPSRFNYTIRESIPFFVIANETWVGGGSGGAITYEIFLGGQKIGEKDVDIVEPDDFEDVRVIRPSPTVPKQLAAFSGKWTGSFVRGGRAHTLIVEKSQRKARQP